MSEMDAGATLRRELGLLSPAELALVLGKSESTLEKLRCARTGPRWVKDGNTILYFRDDVLAWLRGNVIEPDPRAAASRSARA